MISWALPDRGQSCFYVYFNVSKYALYFYFYQKLNHLMNM